MAKQTETKSNTHKINTAMIGNGYYAKIDGSDVVIKPGETEISGLTDEQVRQLQIARVLVS